MKLEDYIIDPEQLKSLGQRLTKLRKALRDLALEKHRQDALWLEKNINDVTVLAEKMHRGYFKGQKHLKDAYFRDFVDDTPAMSRHLSRKRRMLTLQEKIHAVHRVLVLMESRKAVAKELRVSAAVVTKLVRQFNKDGHMQLLIQSEEHLKVK